MAYKPQSSKTSQPKVKTYSGYKDRNLMAANPLKMQEEIKPTDAEPVNIHKRMAGCS